MLQACQKDELPPLDGPSPEEASQQAPISTRSVEGLPTILGSVRANPFKVATMTQAWNLLYGQHLTFSSLPATHQYIKLEPQDIEELKALFASDLPVFDFPLDREVLQMGDHYPQPSLGDEDIPAFYAVLEAGQSSPITNFTVLEDLVIPPMETPLTAAAFFLLSDTLGYFRALYGDDFTGISSIGGEGCATDCPNWPYCALFPDDYDCSGPVVYYHDCLPGSPTWPRCLVAPPGSEPDPPPGPPTNACGCPLPSKRTPAGCIQVEDVQFSRMEGVEDVKVTWYNGWFGVKTARTNGNGCWQIDGHSESGKAYMWVTFRNNRARLRGFVGSTARLWRLMFPITDYRGQLGGGTYNNIQVNYNIWNDSGGTDHRNWSAATTINAIHHFVNEAGNDGINAPPAGLDVFLSSRRSNGAALMFSFLPPGLVQGWQWPFMAQAGLLPDVMLNFPTSVVPDIVIGGDHTQSDRQYAIVQHEFAHASHFTNVGAAYWSGLIAAETEAFIVTGSPWGNANVTGADIIAVCESWAEHIEHVYTDRRYGVNSSIGVTWEQELEEIRNDAPDHVPIGLHLDLFDTNVDTTACDREGGGCGPIVDNVAGFTNGQLFSVLDENTVIPAIYRVRILNELLPGSGNTAANVDALFNSY
jgi:hypothetical protein